MTQYFHFTLGPVQAFVAQARRTRDFWAGSFLLSWLAAVAMREVEAQGGIILFPAPDPRHMQALDSRVAQPPIHGGVPNRFKAEVPHAFLPDQVQRALQSAWESLAESVWTFDLAALATTETRQIWDRQIRGFWETQWVLTEDATESNCIDRMKNWRTHQPLPEPGPKCMMMDGWQELSAAKRPNDTILQSFWKAVRANGKAGIRTDLRPNEQLCAIAFVKRRLVHVFEAFSADMPGGWTLMGWKLPAAVPSVQYIAAAPWLAELLELANRNEAVAQEMWAFHKAAQELVGHGEWQSNIRCVAQAAADKKPWAALDGSVFFDTILENKALWGDQPEQAQHLSHQLRSLRKAAGLAPVSAFYAILRMDGDELGKQMSDPDRQDAITRCLADFANGVDAIVKRHNGFLIYAGGDDVLALVTLEDALPLAAALRAHYNRCFSGTQISTSISAAIEYVHIKLPLAKALAESHHLLDNVAKDQTGRDALAVRVWKPSGIAAVWSMPWAKALNHKDEVILAMLARDLQREDSQQTEGMSTKFFYGLRERFAILNPLPGEEPVLDDAQQRDLLVSQFLNSGVNRNHWTVDRARVHISELIEQCRIHRRIRRDGHPPEIETRPGVLTVDGALLLRFLAEKGVESR